LLLTDSTQAQNQLSEIQFRLDNGLEVYLLPFPRTELVAVVLAVRAGVVDEKPENNGHFHLLEHCLLFRQKHLLENDYLTKILKEYGFYYNAHTEQDLMFFELCLPGDFLESGLELLREVVFKFQVSPEELEKEKKILLTELEDIARDPLKTGLARVYELVFPDSGYGLPVHGQQAAIRQASLEALHQLHNRYFRPNNAALVVCGPLEPSEVKKKIEKKLGFLTSDGQPNLRSVEPPKPLNSSPQVELAMKVSDTYLMVGLTGPDYNNPDRIAMDLLTEILGRGLNPLLYGAFSGLPDLISSASLHYFSHQGTGLIFINIISRAERLQTLRRQLQNFFLKISDYNFSREDFPPQQQYYAFDFLLGGKKRFLWLAEKSLENPLTLAMSLAKHLLLRSESGSRNYLKTVESLSSSDLRKVARKYFSRSQPVWVVIKPE
jgi:predicted Zn-dependent peptidase